jgi:hypothetical protein
VIGVYGGLSGGIQMPYALLDVSLTMTWFFLWVLWIYLLIRVIADIFRSRDLGGWGKAGWLVFVIILPFLGVFGYLIARGGGMADREGRPARDHFSLHRLQDSRADALAKLADLLIAGPSAKPTTSVARRSFSAEPAPDRGRTR